MRYLIETAAFIVFFGALFGLATLGKNLVAHYLPDGRLKRLLLSSSTD